MLMVEYLHTNFLTLACSYVHCIKWGNVNISKCKAKFDVQDTTFNLEFIYWVHINRLKGPPGETRNVSPYSVLCFACAFWGGNNTVHTFNNLAYVRADMSCHLLKNSLGSTEKVKTLGTSQHIFPDSLLLV